MICQWIDKMFKRAFEKKWYNTYWAFDIHGTILIPTFRKNNMDFKFYPWAKETLQLISKRKDIVMIMFTSSYPKEIIHYQKMFKNNNIHFDFINENPIIANNLGNFGFYENKFYFNVLFEDKSGFSPYEEWKPIYDLLTKYNKEEYLPDPNWTIKY